MSAAGTYEQRARRAFDAALDHEASALDAALNAMSTDELYHLTWRAGDLAAAAKAVWRQKIEHSAGEAP